MSDRGYLINTIDPGKVRSNDFPVYTQAVRLRAYGLLSGDIVTLEQQVGEPIDGLWAPVYRGGNPIQLTVDNTQHLEVVSGNYRVVYAGVSIRLAVWYETDHLNLDNNLQYQYAAGSGSGAGQFSMAALDTTTVNLTYPGVTNQNLLSADVNISGDASNGLSVLSDGLYVSDESAYSSSIAGVPGGITPVVFDLELFIVVLCDNSVAATSIHLPQLASLSRTVQVLVKNAGTIGLAVQAIHPFAGDSVEGNGADYMLDPGRGIILTNANSLVPANWWAIGGF